MGRLGLWTASFATSEAKRNQGRMSTGLDIPRGLLSSEALRLVQAADAPSSEAFSLTIHSFCVCDWEGLACALSCSRYLKRTMDDSRCVSKDLSVGEDVCFVMLYLE